MEMSVILGVVAVGLIIGAVFYWRKTGWLAEATPVEPENLEQADGQLVRVAGNVEPGPAGPLQGPLSEQSVAWWSFRVDEEWREVQRNAKGESRGRRRRRNVDRGQSKQPFSLIAGAGQAGPAILVDGHAVEVDAPTQTVNQRDHDWHRGRIQLGNVGMNMGGARGGAKSFVQREWALPVGTPVEAVGTVNRGADGAVHLVSGDRGGLFVTTGTIQRALRRKQLLSAALGGGGVAAGAAAVFLLAA